MPWFYPFALGPYFFVSFFWASRPWRLLHRDPVQLHWEQRPWSSTPSPRDRTSDLPWLSPAADILVIEKGDIPMIYHDIPMFYSNLPRCSKNCLNFKWKPGQHPNLHLWYTIPKSAISVQLSKWVTTVTTPLANFTQSPFGRIFPRNSHGVGSGFKSLMRASRPASKTRMIHWKNWEIGGFKLLRW